jgi:hypothetical protein
MAASASDTTPEDWPRRPRLLAVFPLLVDDLLLTTFLRSHCLLRPRCLRSPDLLWLHLLHAHHLRSYDLLWASCWFAAPYLGRVALLRTVSKLWPVVVPLPELPLRTVWGQYL